MVFGKLIDLQSGKSPSPDGWPIQIVKSVSEFIAIPLSIIFNKSFNSSTLPLDWKSAHITSIHKKRAKKSCFNYRPVSLTPISWKLMESIKKDHILQLSHLLTNNLISPQQFGFVDLAIYNY